MITKQSIRLTKIHLALNFNVKHLESARQNSGEPGILLSLCLDWPAAGGCCLSPGVLEPAGDGLILSPTIPNSMLVTRTLAALCQNGSFCSNITNFISKHKFLKIFYCKMWILVAVSAINNLVSMVAVQTIDCQQSAAVLRLCVNNKKTKTQREVFILVAAR